MPAVFQCPELAAKCDCEARGDGGLGQGWAGETLGLEGEKLRMDGREGMRGLLGSPSGICVGPPAPPGSWVADWAWGEQERRSDSHGKSTELGCRGSVMPGPSLAPGPCWESSALITSSQCWHGPDRERGVAGYPGPVGITRPCSYSFLGLEPGHSGFPPSRAGTSPCSCAWGTAVPRTVPKPPASTKHE